MAGQGFPAGVPGPLLVNLATITAAETRVGTKNIHFVAEREADSKFQRKPLCRAVLPRRGGS